MTLQEYLAAEGLSSEEIAAIVGNEKQAKAMTKALGLADEGRAALTKAQKDQEETERYWAEQTEKVQGAVTRLTAAERKAAEAEADRAQMAAHYVSLAEQGYEVPSEILEKSKRLLGRAPAADPARDPGSGKFVTEEVFNKRVGGVAPDLVSLTKLSNEYAFLKGEPYLNVDQDFAEARKAGKPLTEYARAKYGFDALHAQKDKEKSDAEYQKRFQIDLAAEKAKWAKENGSNPETAAPVPSKFSRLERAEGFKEDSWKSQQGRAANRAARLERFKNLPVM